MMGNATDINIPEDVNRLVNITVKEGRVRIDLDLILKLLQQDSVVLIKELSADIAESIVSGVAESLGLGESLELQAGFAAFQQHRHKVSQYFMTVNQRSDYQFITPHSEGTSLSGIQLASFFCHENSTDGGETILMNVNHSSSAWPSLREKACRAKPGTRRLAPREIARARTLYHVNIPADILTGEDQILGERPTEIPGLTVLDVLAMPQRTYSRILDRHGFVLWDTIASIDLNVSEQYAQLLEKCGLLKQPDENLTVHEMDAAAGRRIWRSNVYYPELFNCKVTCKMTQGDLIILNNLSWTHSANNWSPASGNRRISAAFA